MLVIQEQRQAQVGHGEVAGHLCSVGGIEFFNDFGIHNYEAVRNEVRDEGVDHFSAIGYVEPCLLSDVNTPMREFDSQGIFHRPFR